MKRFVALVALACLVASVPAGAETVYKWKDQNGKMVYGKQPPPKVKAEQVEIDNSKLGGTLGPTGEAGKGAAGEAGGGEPGMTPFAGSWRAKEEADARASGAPPPPPKCPPRSPNPACSQKGAAKSSGPAPGPARPR